MQELLSFYAPRLSDAPAPCLIFDHQGQLLFANPACQDKVAAAGASPQEIATRLHAEMHQKNSTIQEVRLRVHLPDGAGTRHVEWRCVRIPGENDGIFLAWGDWEQDDGGMGFTISANGLIRAASAELCALFGYTQEELAGRPVRQFYFTSSSRKRIVSRLQEHSAVQKGEVTLRHKNGSPLTLWYTAEAIRNAKGRIAAYSGFFQRRPFGSTSKLASEFSRIVDALPGLAWVSTRDHRIAAANDAYLEAYGQNRQDVIGRSEYDFLPPDHARLLTTAALKIFEDKQEVLHPAVPHLPDPQIWHRVVRRPIFDDDRREVIGLLGIAQDITDQVLRENAFMERLRAGQKDVVVVADDQGRILRRSAHVLTPSIYGRPDLYEAYTLDMRPALDLIHADDLGAVRRAMHLVLREHSEQYLECRIRNQAGTYSTVQVRLIYNDTIYREPRMYAVVRDITTQAGLRAAPLVIDRLKKATSSRTDRELADFLNISPASISNARKSDRIPADWLIETGRRTGHSIDWLVSGGSAMLLPSTNT